MLLLFYIQLTGLLTSIVVHREKLQLEIAARERAERKQQEYEDRLRNIQEEMERSHVRFSSYFSFKY